MFTLHAVRCIVIGPVFFVCVFVCVCLWVCGFVLVGGHFLCIANVCRNVSCQAEECFLGFVHCLLPRC